MNPKLVFVVLAVCFAVTSAGRHRRSVYNDHEYPGDQGLVEEEGTGGTVGGEEEPPVEEKPGPIEESPGPVEEKPKEETGGDGDQAGGDNGGEEQKQKEMMAGDMDAQKHKGFCHWGIAVWFKPGFSQRCNCMKCTCQTGGNWKCDYHFPYCPYFYCGNVIFNPHTQICCCGEVHDKRTHFACCGKYYYDKQHMKCCNYYSVKPKKSHCPRDHV